MPLTGWRGLIGWGAAALATSAVAVVLALVMYLASPAAAVALPLAAVAGVMVIRRPIVGVCLGLLVLPLEILDVRFGNTSVTLAENVFLVTAAFGVLHLIAARLESISAAHLAFGALIALAAAGMLYAEDPSVVQRITRVWIAYLVLSLVVARATREELERVLLALATSAGILGVVAVLTRGPQEAQGGGVIVSGRADTGFAHPNVLGFFLLMALPPALVLLARRESAWRRVAMGAATLGILGGLLLTLSRSAIIGAVVALAILALWKDFRRVFAGLLIALGLFAAANFGAIQRSGEVATVSQRLSTVGRVQNIQRDPRADIYARAPSIVIDHPLLGVGEGNFPVVAGRYGLRDPANALPYDHAHNLFLTVAAELGLVGLALFLLFVGAVARMAVVLIRARGPDWPLALAVGAALGGLIVASLVEYPLRTNVNMALVLILVGVLAGLQRVASAGPAATTGPGPAR